MCKGPEVGVSSVSETEKSPGVPTEEGGGKDKSVPAEVIPQRTFWAAEGGWAFF